MLKIADSKIVSLEKFSSKRGTPCATVWITIGNDPLPCRVLVWGDDVVIVSKLYADNKPLPLQITPNRNLEPCIRPLLSD